MIKKIELYSLLLLLSYYQMDWMSSFLQCARLWLHVHLTFAPFFFGTSFFYDYNIIVFFVLCHFEWIFPIYLCGVPFEFVFCIISISLHKYVYIIFFNLIFSLLFSFSLSFWVCVCVSSVHSLSLYCEFNYDILYVYVRHSSPPLKPISDYFTGQCCLSK